MPADASIYNMIRPQAPQQGPLEQYGAMMQLRAMGDQSALHGLQRQQIERNMRDEESASEAARLSGGSMDKLYQMYLDRGLAKPAMDLQGKILTQKKTQADLDKVNLEVESAKGKDARDSLATVTDQPTLDAWIRYAKGKGYRVADAVPAVYDQAAIRAQLLTADKHLEETKPVYKYENIGSEWVLTQQNPRAGKVGDIGTGKLTMTQTPESIASNETTRRGQNMTDARQRESLAETIRAHNMTDTRAREQLDADKFGPPVEVTGPDGKARLALQNKRTGEMVDANTRQPMPGVGPKMGETAQKQQIGVQNTKAAITEYRNALQAFGLTDMASPDARAKMGTVYRNLQLQAKEAYNLGVLNGPDLMIIEQIVTDPTSLKGGIMSKGALDAQAAKLDEIMTRVGQTVTAVQSGNAAPGPSAPAAPTRAQIEAELRRRGAIK